MTPVRHTFQSYSQRFVGINNTSKFGFVFRNIAASFPAAMSWCFTKHCCWHRNCQLSTNFFHGVLKFFIIWFNEEDTTYSSGIIELLFLDRPFLLRFAFCCIRHMLPHIWPYIVGSFFFGETDDHGEMLVRRRSPTVARGNINKKIQRVSRSLGK